MPIPFLLAGAAAVAGVTGIAKGAKAMSNNAEAKSRISRARLMYDNAKEKLEKQRTDTSQRLEYLGKAKLEAWSGEVNTFLDEFKSFQNVQMKSGLDINEKLKLQIENPDSLKEMEVAALNAAEVMQAGLASLGTGALAGIASYGGAMMFASASTGTAIATLSGAAATNATLAWFGGGALSAGGLGMAGGTMVLGGIVAGPVLAVAGFLMEAKSEENLANAEKTYAEAANAAEKMDMMTDFMKGISGIAGEYADFINDYRGKFRTVLQELSAIKERGFRRQAQSRKGFFGRLFKSNSKVDFNLLSPKEQRTLQLAWLMAQVLNAVLKAPLLTQEGNMDSNAEAVLAGAKQGLLEIGQKKAEIERMPD